MRFSSEGSTKMGDGEIVVKFQEDMESKSSDESTSSSFGVARGGPIYLPNMVGHVSAIPEFQSCYLNLLHDLETHLSTVSQKYDVSTDTLKIYTEEELTDMAMKETFQEDTLELQQSLNTNNPSTRSGRKTKRTRTLKKTEEAYVAKVEQLARLKQKQDDDKADVRLHCFTKTCATSIKDVGTGFEQLQSLKSIDKLTGQLVKKPSEIQGSSADTQVILCVEIYDNRKVKTQEFLVLGCQLLTELKDKIHCITDQAMKKAGTYDSSGYFLIENIFHNDLRNPSATDYSKPILDWLWNSTDEAFKKWECISTGEIEIHKKQKLVLGEAKSMDLPRFGSTEMQSIRFCDLRFRVGASYLYCHQGDCKHMIVIRDMRLSHPEDVENRAVYPRLMFQLKPRVQKCSVCKINRASKIALDDKWAQQNPCYFCDMCFAPLHFEGGASLNSNFPLYDYLYE